MIPNGEPYRVLVAELRGLLNVDAIRARNRCVVRCYIRMAKFRGKPVVEAGYQWARPNSHFMSGTVYECALGRGATVEAAMKAARDKHAWTGAA